jgi:hypothetical protein
VGSEKAGEAAVRAVRASQKQTRWSSTEQEAYKCAMKGLDAMSATRSPLGAPARCGARMLVCKGWERVRMSHKEITSLLLLAMVPRVEGCRLHVTHSTRDSLKRSSSNK